MYGTRGTRRRRRIILGEFTSGVVVMAALGSWLLISASGLGGLVLGAWMLGASLNYAPLTAYAIVLSRPGALEAELAGVDTDRELRRYGILQFWIAVPLSLVIITVSNSLARRQSPGDPSAVVRLPVHRGPSEQQPDQDRTS